MLILRRHQLFFSSVRSIARMTNNASKRNNATVPRAATVYDKITNAINELEEKDNFLTNFRSTNHSTIESSQSSVSQVPDNPYLQKCLDLIDLKINYYSKINKPLNSVQYNTLKTWIKWIASRKTVLFSIDLEVFEIQQKVPTEIGVSVLDFRNQESSVYPNIVNFHFLVKEYLHCKNHKYVPDNKYRHINGPSIVVPKASIPKILDSLLAKYGYSKEKYNMSFSAENLPPLVLVGQNFGADIKFLRSCFDYELDSRIPVLDTMTVWKTTFERSQMKKSNLGYILKILNIPAIYLHNGANDAYYTIIALIKLLDPQLRCSLYCANYEEMYNRETEITEEESMKKQHMWLYESFVEKSHSKHNPPHNAFMGSVDFSSEDVDEFLSHF